MLYDAPCNLVSQATGLEAALRVLHEANAPFRIKSWLTEQQVKCCGMVEYMVLTKLHLNFN